MGSDEIDIASHVDVGCLDPSEAFIEPDGGLPSRRDDKVHANTALETEAGFELLHESGANAAAAERGIDGKVIDVASAAVPAAENSASDAATGHSDDEEAGVAGEFPGDFGRFVGGAELDARTGSPPEREDGIEVGLALAGAYPYTCRLQRRAIW